MKLSNAKVYIDGAFVEGGLEFEKDILAAGAGVTGGEDMAGAYIIPGLIDMHSHAAVGADASDGIAEGLTKMSLYYAKDGVTSWCPTTMTLKEPELNKAMDSIREFSRPQNGAKIAGIHMEGPFVNMEKRGAQNPENIAAPDVDLFHRLNERSGHKVKIITMAPEEPGAMEFIKEVSKECLISVGHTTSNYDTAMEAYRNGAGSLTHLFNAMPSLLHREPGCIAAAVESGSFAEIITDGIHVHPAAIRIAHKLFGKRLILISDSLRCAGMPDGEYELGGQPITMKDGKATLSGTDTIAGSSIHLMEGLRRTVSFGIPLEEAVYAVTAAPAKAIKEDERIGSLGKGKAADFVVLDKDLKVLRVFIDGEEIKQ